MLCSAPCLVTTACVCYLSLFLYHLIFTTVGEGGFIIISIIAIIILILQIMEGQRDEGTYPRSPLSKWWGHLKQPKVVWIQSWALSLLNITPSPWDHLADWSRLWPQIFFHVKCILCNPVPGPRCVKLPSCNGAYWLVSCSSRRPDCQSPIDYEGSGVEVLHVVKVGVGGWGRRSTFPTFSSCVFPPLQRLESSELHFPDAHEFLPPGRKQWRGSHTSAAPTVSPGKRHCWQSGLFMILKDSGALGGASFCSRVLEAIPESQRGAFILLNNSVNTSRSSSA